MINLINYIILAALAAGFYVGWNVGSNDAANSMGAAVGGGILTYRRAVAILVIFVVLGAVLEGWKVMGTVGEGIVVSNEGNPFTEIPIMGVISLIVAGLWVNVASKFGFPVSTSQSIIGSVMGAGALISIIGPVNGITAAVEFSKVGRIGLSWVVSPFAAALSSFTIYKLIAPVLRRVTDVTTLNRVFSLLIIGAGAFTAYTLGTNDVGASMGVLYAVSGGASIWSVQNIALLGGVAVAVGALTYSRNVMQTVGTGITQLDVVTAFAAQIGAATVVWSFNQFGIPVSTSQAIVGGVIGVGLVKGTEVVSKTRVGKIVMTWIVTPMLAASMTFIIGLLAITVMT